MTETREVYATIARSVCVGSHYPSGRCRRRRRHRFVTRKTTRELLRYRRLREGEAAASPTGQILRVQRSGYTPKGDISLAARILSFISRDDGYIMFVKSREY